jgi:hypothetical protein
MESLISLSSESASTNYSKGNSSSFSLIIIDVKIRRITDQSAGRGNRNTT